MTETLINALKQQGKTEFIHLNTQVSRSLSDKGRRQLSKALLGIGQALRFVTTTIRYRPDVVYFPLTNSISFNGFIRDAFFILFPSLLGIAVAIHLRGGCCLYTRYGGMRRLAVRKVLSRVTIAIVQGRNLLGCFADMIPRERIAIVPNGIQSEPFEAARKRVKCPNSGNGRTKILFVGKLCREKGIFDVLRAMPAVPSADFAFMGEWGSGAEREEAETLVRANGLSGRASFLGVLGGASKYEQFVSSDILVFPTYFPQEGLSVACVEALAAGLPIVCTDHGALCECVQPERNGFFVPKFDPEAIAARLNTLAADDELRTKMGKCSRKIYEERFTVPHFVNAWIDAMERCAAARENRN